MLTFNLDDHQATQSLARLINNAQNSRPLMRSLATELQTLTDDNFDDESFGGQSWQAKAFGSGRILQDTGELKDSISTSSDRTTASIGTNLIYARIHHFGGTVQAKNKPHLIFRTPSGFARVGKATIPSRPFCLLAPQVNCNQGHKTACLMRRLLH